MKIYPFFSMILLLLLSLSVSAGLYRWVDAQGNISYSDKIPPVAAKYGHVELNDSGIRKKIELSASQKQSIVDIQDKKIKERKEQEKRNAKAALKKVKDERLLSIYATRKELTNVYESKIKVSLASLKLLKKRHKVLSERLAITEIKHERMKNPKFKDILEKKIDDMLDGLKVYQQAITESLVENSKLEKQYIINLKRFDNLSEKDQPAYKNIDALRNTRKLASKMKPSRDYKKIVRKKPPS